MKHAIDAFQIEFPSILLPAHITSGSIVDINVSRNFESEQAAVDRFTTLQSQIYSLFGQTSPAAPVLRCRNATQTSVVLEWDPIQLATADLRCLSLYRNGAKAGNIPRDKLSTKISGLAIDTQYNFQLVLRTSAGTYRSERLDVTTQKMTDLTGITISPGIMPPQLRDDLGETARRINAKFIDTVRIDTTHFVCTEGRGQAWEKAVEMNVPVVVPDWLKGCEREGRIVGVRGYYLDADPKYRELGPSVEARAQQTSPRQQRQLSPPHTSGHVSRTSQHIVGLPGMLERPTIEHTPPTPEQTDRTSRTSGLSSSRVPSPPPKGSALRGNAQDAESDDDTAAQYGAISQTDMPPNTDHDHDHDHESQDDGARHDNHERDDHDIHDDHRNSTQSFKTDTGGAQDDTSDKDDDQDDDLPDRSRSRDDGLTTPSQQRSASTEGGFDEVEI